MNGEFLGYFARIKTNKILKRSGIVLSVLLFTSCASTYKFSIDVLSQPEVNFKYPPKKVLLLNSPNTNNIGNYSENTDSASVKLNQISVEAFQVTLANFHEISQYSPFFNNCDLEVISPDSIAYVSNFTIDKKSLSELRKNTSADYLISIDYFSIDSIDKPVQYAELKSIYRIYNLISGKPEHLKLITDSIFIEPLIIDTLDIEKRLAILSGQIKFSCPWIAEAMAFQIFPIWEKFDRKIYIAGDRNLIKAAKYFRKGKEDEAAALWNYVYENSNDNFLKFKAAYNLAVYYELKGELYNAIQLLYSAMQLTNSKKHTDYYTYLSQRYRKQLSLRNKFRNHK